jgi:molybdopterin molybdotransferase
VRLRVRGAVPMGGEHDGAVGPGEAVAITTGGKLPAGADAVLMIEHVRPEPAPPAAGAVPPHPGEIAALRALRPGANVIHPGDDFRTGEVLIPAGRRLRPQDVGLLAGLGLLEIAVHRPPRVGVVSTGDELVPPAARDLAPGQIRDVNQTVLSAQVRRAGAVAVVGGIVPDREEALRDALTELLAACDVVLVSGGSSVGTHDLVERVATGLPGAVPLFHGINVRPGKPTMCLRVGDRALIGMPGHPVSSMVIFDAFVRPFLQRLGGERLVDAWPARRRAVMTASCRKTPGRDEYVRVALTPPVGVGAPWSATAVRGGSALFASVVRADGVVLVPAARDHLDAGDEVEVLLYD